MLALAVLEYLANSFIVIKNDCHCYDGHLGHDVRAVLGEGTAPPPHQEKDATPEGPAPASLTNPTS